MIIIMKQTISGYCPLQLAGSREEARELIASDSRVNELAVKGWDDAARTADELGNNLVKVTTPSHYYELRFV